MSEEKKDAWDEFREKHPILTFTIGGIIGVLIVNYFLGGSIFSGLFSKNHESWTQEYVAKAKEAYHASTTWRNCLDKIDAVSDDMHTHSQMEMKKMAKKYEPCMDSIDMSEVMKCTNKLSAEIAPIKQPLTKAVMDISFIKKKCYDKPEN